MPMQAESQWLRTNSGGMPSAVDREKRIISGYVLAERGPFKSPGRGEFDDDGLRMIAEQINARGSVGIKSRFAHPSLSGDGIGTFLGRAKNARVDNGKVRGDLHLDPSASKTPSGDLADYVMTLAESDPAAFGSSLVLQVDKKVRLTEKGERQKDDKGEDLPPLWYPKKIHASDIVDEGDAVHNGFLSVGGVELDVDELPDGVVHAISEVLNRAFPDQPRAVTEARCVAFLGRYLDRRYGPTPGQDVATLRRRLRMKELEIEVAE